MKRKVLTPHVGLATGIGYYLSGMEEVRQQLIDLIDHEAQHKGQILMLKRLMV